MYKYKNQISKLLIISLFLPLIYFSTPKQADAQVPVTDPAHTGVSIANMISLIATHVKEYVLDTLATNIAKTIIKQLTAQTVNWINSGFKGSNGQPGSPAYLTDPGQFFLNVGDTQAAQFLSEDSVLKNLCTPFQAKVRLALAKTYLQETDQANFSCTLGIIEQNFDAFTNDFNQGGWDGWFSMTQNVNNNPYGSYLKGKDQLTVQIGQKTTDYSKQLDRAKGFLDFERCKPGSPIVGKIDKSDPNSIARPTSKCAKMENLADIPTIPGTGVAQIGPDGKPVPGGKETGGTPSRAPQCLEYEKTQEKTDSNGQIVDSGLGEGDCTEKETVTPGSIIAGKLEGVLGTDLKQLELVQSINQVVGALITQLTQQIVGGIGNGLRGMSNSSPSSNSRSLIESLASPSVKIDPATNKPVPDLNSENGKEFSDLEKGIKSNNQTPPSMTLIEPSVMDVVVNTEFVDPGVVAADLVDGPIPKERVVKTPPTIDTTTIGTYTIVYSVTNLNGIPADHTVSRIVNVVATPTPTATCNPAIETCPTTP